MNQKQKAVEHFNKLILGELYAENINCWLAGGCVRDYLLGIDVVADYDLFFPNEQEFQKAKNYFLKKSHNILWESDNSWKIEYNGLKIDLVKKKYCNPFNTISCFDFTVCKFAIDKTRLYCNDEDLLDLLKKELVFYNIADVFSTFQRMNRFLKRGYVISEDNKKHLLKKTAVQLNQKVGFNVLDFIGAYFNLTPVIPADEIGSSEGSYWSEKVVREADNFNDIFPFADNEPF
jgi:hypothetical protein